MSELTIRDADPARDAAACAAIYAPHVEGSAVSFEEQAPDATELATRIERYGASHAWLVAEREGEVVGYAYATAFNERPAYRWSAGVSVYVAEGARGQGVGRALYEALFERLREQRRPHGLRRDNAAERGERRSARGARLRAVRPQP